MAFSLSVEEVSCKSVVSQDTLRALFAEEETIELSNISVSIVVSTTSIGTVRELETSLTERDSSIELFSFLDAFTIDGITEAMLVSETEYIELDLSMLRRDTSRRKSIGLTKRKLCEIYDQDKQSFLLAFEMFVYNSTESVDKGAIVCKARFISEVRTGSGVADTAVAGAPTAASTPTPTSAEETIIDSFLETDTTPQSGGAPEPQPAAATAAVSSTILPPLGSSVKNAPSAESEEERGDADGESGGGMLFLRAAEPVGPAPSTPRRYSSPYGRVLRLP